jgi:glycerol-3-phosphate acyltransferase PlsY
MTRTVAVVGLSYLLGSLPFSNLAARTVAGVDLRRVGSGTVSGTSLHAVAGFGPLAVAGILDVGKGAVGPLLLHGDLIPMAIAGSAAIAGHNWSLFLRGAGGRGISPALGALAVIAWPGAIALLVGLVVGRLLHHTAVVSLISQAALVPILISREGAAGALAAALLLIPMWAKRLAGNRWPVDPPILSGLLERWLFDRDRDAGDRSARSTRTA